MDTGSKVRTTIVKVPDATPGLLFLNGQQKSFTLEGLWKSPVAPAPNMTVDVDVDAMGAITSIAAVDAKAIAQERMHQLGDAAKEHGAEGAKVLWAGLLKVTSKMGAVAFGASVLIWIAWFFLPAAAITALGSMSLTFWDVLGIDTNNPASLTSGGGSHGFFGLLGIVAIAVPFAVPLISATWAKFLNAAPLAYVLIGFATVYTQIHKALAPLEGGGGPSIFSWSWGLFVLGAATLVLAAHALKGPVGQK
jgi:hypothetical protein